MSIEAYDYGKKDGIQEEQARIIELLEGMDVYPTAFDLEIKDLIALIKGESQKDNETVVLLTEGENK
jgi:hypothetical protein